MALLRIRTFLREPEALFWTFGFPILMAIGLGIAFGGDGTVPVPVAVVEGSAAADHRDALQASPDLDVHLLTGLQVVDGEAVECAFRADRIAEAGLEEVEVAALVGLQDVLGEHPAIAAAEPGLRLYPGRPARRQFIIAHQHVEPAVRHVEPHGVAIS